MGLVGSTIRTLAKRRVNGYTRRFGQGVELRLIREIPRPEDYSDSDYNFYLKACEAMDIARKKTYIEHGGLNKISPLIQAYGKSILEEEMGKIGGRIGIRKMPREAMLRGASNAGKIGIKKMSREANKSIWLVSHKDELAGRVNNTLHVIKENGYTSYNTDVDIV